MKSTNTRSGHGRLVEILRSIRGETQSSDREAESPYSSGTQPPQRQKGVEFNFYGFPKPTPTPSTPRLGVLRIPHTVRPRFSPPSPAHHRPALPYLPRIFRDNLVETNSQKSPASLHPTLASELSNVQKLLITS